MTERKPPGVGFESWVDRQIREAEQRGDFARLPGTGKPLPDGQDTTYDELWWLKRKMDREGLTVLPPSLALRKEAEDALESALAAPTEAAARRTMEAVNKKIREMQFRPPPGPPLGIPVFDLDDVAGQWRARHP